MLPRHHEPTVHGAYSSSDAATYDADRETEAIWRIENEYVHAMVARTNASCVLDVPVGTGRFLSYYGGKFVTGIDLSSAMLREASERISTAKFANVALALGSISSLPFNDKQFDLVVTWRLFHLLPREVLAHAMAELARVCRGTLCIQTYECASLTDRLAARANRWARRCLLIFRSRHQLTPWSHIQSYTHSSHDIEHAALQAGLGLPTSSDTLGGYEGMVVKALIWKFVQ